MKKAKFKLLQWRTNLPQVTPKRSFRTKNDKPRAENPSLVFSRDWHGPSWALSLGLAWPLLGTFSGTDRASLRCPPRDRMTPLWCPPRDRNGPSRPQRRTAHLLSEQGCAAARADHASMFGSPHVGETPAGHLPSLRSCARRHPRSCGLIILANSLGRIRNRVYASLPTRPFTRADTMEMTMEATKALPKLAM